MIFNVDRIMRDVRVTLDQDRTSTALFADGDVDSLKLDDIIRSKMLEGVQRVHLVAPYHLLEQGHNITDDVEDVDDNDWDNDTEEIVAYGPSIHWADQESGWIVLPDDFMRLVVFEMSDWERPVYEAITPADPQYAKCRSRVKAICGTAQRPVVAIGVRPEGRVLEFYSCKNEQAVVSRGVYIPYPAITTTIETDGDEVEGVDISERCYDAVVYTIAALVLTAISEPDKATLYNDKAKTLLGI